MSANMVEIMNKGMKCLTDQMGIVEAEQFIFLIIKEKFDYTKWQRGILTGKRRKKSAGRLLILNRRILFQTMP